MVDTSEQQTVEGAHCACRALAAATALTPESMQAAHASAKEVAGPAEDPAASGCNEAAQAAGTPREHLLESAAASASGVATAMADAATGPLAVPRAALAPDLLLRGPQRTSKKMSAPTHGEGLLAPTLQGQ